MFALRAIVFAIALVIGAGTAHATTNSFSYEGRLYDNVGNPLNSSAVDFRIEIYSGSGACLLYQETHSANLSSVNTHEQGVFSLKIGSGTRTGSDPGLAFIDIFKNTGTIVGASGCNYTPGTTDIRHLRVHVDNGSGFETLAPDFDVLSAPGTMVAQSLQGKAAGEFLQVSAGVTQINLESLFNGSDASAFHTHDSLYVKIGAVAAQNLGSGNLYTNGQVGIGTSTPTSGVELHVKDVSSVATVKIEGAAAAGSKILFNDAAVERASIYTEGGTSALVISTGGVTALRVDSAQNVRVIGSVFSDGLLRSGQVSSGASETSMSAVLTSTCGAGCSGGTWYRTDTGEFRIWDNSKPVRTIAAYENSPTTNDVLRWDGTRWLPSAISSVDSSKLPLTGGTISGAMTVTGAFSAGAIGTNALGATSISSGSVTANTITVSLAPATGTDAVNKNYADAFLAGRSIPAPTVGQDLQSIRWNNSSNAYEYFSGLASGSSANQVVANSGIPNCISSEKLQMSAGPTYAWSCVPDYATDTSKLPLTGGTLSGALVANAGINASSLTTNSLTVSLTPVANLDAVNKIYSDTHIGSRSLPVPLPGNDGQSVRWNNSLLKWEYFSSVALGTTAGRAIDISSIPNCTATEKLEMSAGPVYSLSCVADYATDTTKLALAGGTMTGALISNSSINASSVATTLLTISMAPATTFDGVNKAYSDTRLASRTIASLPNAGNDGQSLRWNNTTSSWEYFTAGQAGAGVLTFNGRFGVVNPATNDYTWAQIDKTVSSLADLTTRSAADLSTGTLADARLSANIVKKNATNAFSVGGHTINIESNLVKGLTIKGASTQSASLAEFQNVGGTVLYTVSPSAAPSLATDLANKGYVDALVGAYVKADGSVAMTGNLDMNGSNKVVNLATPTTASEAANKGYVDGLAALAMVTITGNGSVTISGPITAPTIGVRYGTTAGTALQGNQSFSGDVTGTVGAMNVGALQGTAIASTTPTSGQYLAFSSGSWRPASVVIPGSSVGTSEISDGTVASVDIADGTIVNADISASAAIALTKISGYGSMCVQNQGAVTITGGRANFGTLTISGSSGDVLDVAAASGGGMKLSSLSAGTYVDLIDSTGKTGSIEMDGNGVFKLHNSSVGGLMILAAGSGTTTVSLLPTQNKVDVAGAYISNVGNPTIGTDAVNQNSDIGPENEPTLLYVSNTSVNIRARRVGFKPYVRMPSGDIYRSGSLTIPINVGTTNGYHYLYMVRKTDNTYVTIDGGTAYPVAGLSASSLVASGLEWRYLGAVYANGSAVQKFVQDGNNFYVAGLASTNILAGTVTTSSNIFPKTSKTIMIEAYFTITSASCTQVISHSGDAAYPAQYTVASSAMGAGTAVSSHLTIPMDSSAGAPVLTVANVSGSCTPSITQRYLGFSDGYL